MKNKDAQAEADLQHYLQLLESAAPEAAPERSEGPDHARMMPAHAERRGDYAAPNNRSPPSIRPSKR